MQALGHSRTLLDLLVLSVGSQRTPSDECAARWAAVTHRLHGKGYVFLILVIVCLSYLH